MALRLFTKIRCNILPKFTRSFTVKTETAACTIQQQKQDQNVLGKSPANSPNFNVYTAPSLARTAENENMLRKQMENTQLQPSKLPNYYKSEIDVQQGTYPICDALAHNPSAPLSLQQRHFEVSKTCANVTLPLKAPKLASPFPDPVKMMTSHTISDQEKADQMMAEARIPKTSVEPVAAKPAPNRVYRRYYSSGGKIVSSDEEKCKKIGKKKSKCVKMVAPGCKKPKTITCDKKRKPIECKKVNAPYPSYSEACYEDVLEKPSECKLCPWRPKDNPHFKGTKKKYHTKPTDKENVADIVAKRRDADGYWLDAKKVPPEKKKDKTKKNKSGQGKTKDESKKKTSRKSKGKKKKRKGGKGKKAENWTTAVNRYGKTKEEEETDIVINSKMIVAKEKNKDKEKKKPCNKFPFDKCKKKKDNKEKKEDKCRKKKKPTIKGCLNNNENSWETVEIITETGQKERTLAKLSKDKAEKHESDKKYKPKKRDECEVKKPTSRICPGDLVDGPKRIRRRSKKDKKKWTSARAKPYMAKRNTKAYRASKTENAQKESI